MVVVVVTGGGGGCCCVGVFGVAVAVVGDRSCSSGGGDGVGDGGGC